MKILSQWKWHNRWENWKTKNYHASQDSVTWYYKDFNTIVTSMYCTIKPTVPLLRGIIMHFYIKDNVL